MMKTKTVVIILLIGIQWIVLIVSESHDLASTIYVVTDEEHCPTEQSCYTFSDLVTFSDRQNFSLDTTLMMSSGNHSISKENNATEILLIHDIDYFEMTSFNNNQLDSKATKSIIIIHCASPLKFEFRNVTSLKISGITFEYCGSVQNFSLYTFNVTVLVINSTSLDISYVTISNTKGVGLLIQNVRQKLSMSNVRLSHNEVNCYIEYISKTINSTRYNYSIINSTFSFGNMLKPGKYYIKGANRVKTISASGLHIRMVRILGKLNLTDNILHENKGRINTNLRLDFSTISSESHIITDVIVKRLTSTSLGDRCNGFVVQCISSNNCFNLKFDVEDSTFKNCCISVGNVPNARLINIAIQKSRCHRSLNLLKAMYITLDNVIITESYGKSAIRLFESIVNVVNQFHIQQNKGGIRLERNSRFVFDVRCNAYITSNTVMGTGFTSVLYSEDSEIIFENNTYIKFMNNTSNLGGAITAVSSVIDVVGCNTTLIFENNKGSNGGAVAMYDGSQILLPSVRFVTIRFAGNMAVQKGGAIYVDTASYLERRNTRLISFVKLKNFANLELCPNVQYVNNTAILAGNNIFGGWIDYWLGGRFCRFTEEKNTNNTLLSSDPVRICICTNTSIPDCSKTEHTIEVFPGETFAIDAVAVGWRFGTVPAIVQARFAADTGNATSMKNSQYVQSVHRNCTRLTYELRSANKYEKIHLFVDKTNVPNVIANTSLLSKELFLNVVVKTCVPGFLFNSSLSVCVCHPFLAKYKTECNMELFKVIRSGQVWITANKENVLAISRYCPYDYCKTSSELELLDLEYPDQQCSFNRSGVLCGRCQANFSHVFGTSKCKECSNLWVILIIPVFILAGIALVAFVMVLNLTVSVGTINGLIFYANIVRSNQAIFFPPETANSFLSWFVAWINFDLGIEVCFYNGLDAYAKTWFQFLFPLYIWFIVTTIIVLSRHFDNVAKLFGNNAVPVLATLFLLSYAKLLRIIITIFQPSQLDYSDGNSTRAWLYDGNVSYLKGKHIPLFIVALAMLLFLSFPYTAVLLTIQWLQKVNQYRIFFWVNRLKPLLDAYAGPYKDKHRYWTGLLLLDRVILFLIFSLNVSNNPSVNLLAIIVTQILVFSHSFLVGRVYKSRLTNAIELSFHINVSLLAATTLFQISTSLSPKLSTNISASIAFITFAVISITHLVQRVVKYRFPQHKDIFANLKEWFAPKKANAVETTVVQTDGKKEGSGVSTTFVELREPLIDC